MILHIYHLLIAYAYVIGQAAPATLASLTALGPRARARNTRWQHIHMSSYTRKLPARQSTTHLRTGFFLSDYFERCLSVPVPYKTSQGTRRVIFLCTHNTSRNTSCLHIRIPFRHQLQRVLRARVPGPCRFAASRPSARLSACSPLCLPAPLPARPCARPSACPPLCLPSRHHFCRVRFILIVCA